jgi:hypothetical protein
LQGIGADLEPVTAAEHHQLTVTYRAPSRNGRAFLQPSPGTADAAVVLRNNVARRPLSKTTTEAAHIALTLAARDKERATS